MLTNDQLSRLKNMLLDEKASLTHQISEDQEMGNLKGSQKEVTGELSSYDNHPADSGTELFERSKDMAIDAHHEDQLKKVTEALQAIEDGFYGQCAECGKEILFERLEAVPYSLYCLEHSNEHSSGAERSVEEQFLDATHTIEFQRKQKNEVSDPENSFSEVAQFGTSETPADFTGSHEDYDSLYSESNPEEGYTEEFESFSGTDMNGKNKYTYPNNEQEKYKKMLDETGLESQLGDIPYKNEDSYLEDDQKETD